MSRRDRRPALKHPSSAMPSAVLRRTSTICTFDSRPEPCRPQCVSRNRTCNEDLVERGETRQEEECKKKTLRYIKSSSRVLPWIIPTPSGSSGVPIPEPWHAWPWASGHVAGPRPRGQRPVLRLRQRRRRHGHTKKKASSSGTSSSAPRIEATHISGSTIKIIR